MSMVSTSHPGIQKLAGLFHKVLEITLSLPLMCIVLQNIILYIEIMVTCTIWIKPVEQLSQFTAPHCLASFTLFTKIYRLGLIKTTQSNAPQTSETISVTKITLTNCLLIQGQSHRFLQVRCEPGNLCYANMDVGSPISPFPPPFRYCCWIIVMGKITI